MSDDKAFVAYFRVSTEKQGRSGLGLEAQRQAVAGLVNGNGSRVVAEYTEQESGCNPDRPELEKAIRRARAHGARLVVARLDRLSRDAAFILGRLRDEEVDFICADMPQADRLSVGVFAVVAEREAELISTRTKEALAAARARGTKLGGHPERLSKEDRRRGGIRSGEVRAARADRRALDLAPIMAEVQAEGAESLRDLAAGLNERGIPTARGSTWRAASVKRILDRLDRLERGGDSG